MIEIETAVSLAMALFAIFTVFGLCIMFPLLWILRTIFHS